MSTKVEPVSKSFVSKLDPILNVRNREGLDTWIDLAGATAEANGIKYKLNPIKNLCDGDGYVDAFLDPTASTIQANGYKCYLNPIKTAKDWDTKDKTPMSYRFLDPGMATVTANVFKDEKDAKIARAVLNPVAAIVGAIFG